MQSLYSIVQAEIADAETVGQMVYQMEAELWEGKEEELDKETFITSARTLLQPGRGYWAFLAKDDKGSALGVLTINQCSAIYAGGIFGEIMEIYIEPASRSSGVGHQLVAVAKKFAQEQGWPILEVGSPAQPRWQRTFNFYVREGFKEIGPRLELTI